MLEETWIMSGVVMNGDDEAGLLDLDERDEEDFDDGDGDYTYDLSGRKGRLKSKLNLTGAAKRATQSAARAGGGSVGQLMHTLLICGVFFGAVNIHTL